MGSSAVPTLKLDGRNWKVFWVSLLKAAATKGWLGILSGQETNDESLQWEGKDAQLKMLFYQTKPVEALSDNETQELCTKPNKLSVELPSGERLEDKLTEARSEGEAEAAVGAAQQTPSRSVEFEEYIPDVPKVEDVNRAVELASEAAGHARGVDMSDEMASEDLPSKLLLLKGEQAVCTSGSPRNPNGIEDEQLRIADVNLYCSGRGTDADTSVHEAHTPNVRSGTTNGQSCYTEEPQLTIYDLGGTLEWPTASCQKAETDEGEHRGMKGHYTDTMDVKSAA
ncbi:hypothetical protein EDD16DRAFT_1518487 [Pisolithus croceorrhizus]|nr:hypothetical protein EV401DRAFT_1895622 [Pisolithus croceorrhizus]KAI6122157.1 hypothetical protein EDD16DRAFT_1518487 [Pisolithus croceorrhizus]